MGMSACSIVSKIAPSEQVGKRAMSGVHFGKPVRFPMRLMRFLHLHSVYTYHPPIPLQWMWWLHLHFIPLHRNQREHFSVLCTSPQSYLLPWGFVAKSDPVWGAKRVSCVHGAVLGWLVAADPQLVIVWFVFHPKGVVSGYSVDVVLVPHVHLQLVVLWVSKPWEMNIDVRKLSYNGRRNITKEWAITRKCAEVLSTIPFGTGILLCARSSPFGRDAAKKNNF